jgi:hypothetical protein
VSELEGLGWIEYHLQLAIEVNSIIMVYIYIYIIFKTLIKYEGDKKCEQWLNICSFVFAYAHIVVLIQ